MDPTHHLHFPGRRRNAPATEKLVLDVMDRNAFAQLLRKSGLMRERHIEQALIRAQTGDRALDFASLLVHDGLLTSFQASELLAGRWAGFVLGPYRILDRIDRGGVGNVFRAIHTVMSREVAVKAIPVDRIRERRTRLQFRQEIRTLARMQHPHIVHAYDANRVGSVFYLAMELVHGPNLDRLVHEQGPIAPVLAWSLLRQAAEALQYAHEHGVIHCDVKPGNLLIAHAPGWQSWERIHAVLADGPQPLPAPLLKILDFGIARVRGLGGMGGPVENLHSSQPRDGAGIYGTPDYVAPEQAQDLGQADARSDLYSLGCTFYFALAGRVPFEGDSTMDKLIGHLTELPTPLEELCPGLPPPLASLIRRLMAKQPGERYQSAAELRAALERMSFATPLKLMSAVEEAS